MKMNGFFIFFCHEFHELSRIRIKHSKEKKLVEISEIRGKLFSPIAIHIFCNLQPQTN